MYTCGILCWKTDIETDVSYVAHSNVWGGASLAHKWSSAGGQVPWPADVDPLNLSKITGQNVIFGINTQNSFKLNRNNV